MLDKDSVRALALANGFTVKEGQEDLKDYVFDFAEAVQKEALVRTLVCANPAVATATFAVAIKLANTTVLDYNVSLKVATNLVKIVLDELKLGVFEQQPEMENKNA